jgi:hypothetical protein
LPNVGPIRPLKFLDLHLDIYDISRLRVNVFQIWNTLINIDICWSFCKNSEPDLTAGPPFFPYKVARNTESDSRFASE